MSMTSEEVERYARHIVLKEIGGPGQQRLRAASVLIIGAGGLGAPAALYLAAAGVGRLGLVDFDAVSLSNLQRQILFKSSDLGRFKLDAAADVLSELNPNVGLELHLARLTETNAARLIEGYDLVLDGSDTFETRFAVNAACHEAGIAIVSGAVGRWSAQVGVFASGRTKDKPQAARAPCYRCLVPETPPDAEACERAGIVGALTGVAGAMMALEAIKLVTGAGEPLIGRLWLYDALQATSRTIALPADPACPVCGEAP